MALVLSFCNVFCSAAILFRVIVTVYFVQWQICRNFAECHCLMFVHLLVMEIFSVYLILVVHKGIVLMWYWFTMFDRRMRLESDNRVLAVLVCGFCTLFIFWFTVVMTIVVFNLMSSHKKISYDLLICMTAHRADHYIFALWFLSSFFLLLFFLA